MHKCTNAQTVGVVFGLSTHLIIFSVTPVKIDQNKKKSKSKPSIDKAQSLGKGRKVNMQRLPPRFKSLQFLLGKVYGQFFLPHLKRLVWRRHAAGKPTETSVTEYFF